MTLEKALHILASVHTKDDAVTGFHVLMGATPNHWEWDHSEYIGAWEAVRKFAHMQIEPSQG